MEWGDLNLEQKIVPANTVITQPFGTTDVNLKPIDGANALQEKWKDADGVFPVIMLRKYDTELAEEIQEYLQIVAQGRRMWRRGRYGL